MRSIPISIPGSEFNDFLFAPICEDRNGMSVSVLSGLARSDVDPWQEAANLAQLPEETATQRLTALIGALPDRASAYPDARTIALARAAAGPGCGQRRIERSSTRSWCGDEVATVVGLRGVHVLHVGLPILDSNPSSAGES
jgi:hypothetical protein